LHTLWVIIGGLAVALIGLAVETLLLRRMRRRLPIRILVIGTRGKSSVTRLVHARLRDAGCRVLGKTTGSRPRILLPDGEETPITRRGAASILEQKRVLRRAVETLCDVLVIEGMAISPENAQAESLRIIQPTHILLTNARVDHVELAGSTERQVARSLTWAIPHGVPVYIPQSELGNGGVRDVLQSSGGHIIAVPDDGGARRNDAARGSDAASRNANPQAEFVADTGARQFVSNLKLAEACCRDLGIRLLSPCEPRSGLPADFHADPGELHVLIDPENDVVIANAFSANEPLSTELAVSAIYAEHPELVHRPMIGVFNVRHDRGDRTHLWLSALRRNMLPFAGMVLVGDRAHGHAAVRMIRQFTDIPAITLRERGAEQLAVRLGRMYRQRLLLCFGNFAGIGQELTDVWQRTCDEYGR